MIGFRKLILFFMVPLFALAGTLQGNAVSAASGPEGIEWRLAEVGGAPVAPLARNKQPSLMLDQAQKKASGFAGCNTFFCSYTLDGSSLKLGPIGSTRRACPERESALEKKFLSALERSDGWKIQDGVLLLLDVDEVLARFTMGKFDESAVNPGSMTYRLRSLSPGTVTLSGGTYRAPAAPGSASEIMVKLIDKRIFGTAQGRETGAVVLVVSFGGTGSFSELALLSKSANGWENADTVLLGDRVIVRSVGIENDHLVVDMTTHGPNDPLCCPTMEAKRRFALQGNRLVPADDGIVAGTPRIIGTVWVWMRTRYNNDTTVVPSKPENYTVRFLENGSLEVKADCNLKGGTYFLEGRKLSIKITHSTMAACGQGSLEEQFVRDLAAGARSFVKEGDLFIDLNYDSGTMRFSGKKE